MLRLGARDLPMSTAGAHALSVEALCIAPALPHLFAELMSLHYDPHAGQLTQALLEGAHAKFDAIDEAV